jgi:hypothetical protein
MRVFRCDCCGDRVPFAVQECGACGAALGYVSEDRNVRLLLPSKEAATYEVVGRDGRWWRCMNSAWGCNWMLTAASDTVWCRSCRLTRGRPDGERPDAVEAWVRAEAAKRRLVHQLDMLGLSFEMRSTSTPDGLVFDLVHVPGERGVTGHFDGVVTLDLAEADDRYRDALRRQLGESFRTVIGHLRHEVGHYFWSRLVGRSDRLSSFRGVFGDERIAYREAVATYYSGGVTTWDDSSHVTAYAASHPLEDWAETFAHYLHIVDAADTAIAHQLVPADGVGTTVAEALATGDFDDVLDVWRPINVAVNAIAESVGSAAVYPFELSGDVVDKLAFVHRQVAAHAHRERSHASR